MTTIRIAGAPIDPADLPPGTVLVQADDGEAREFTSLAEAEAWLDWKDNQVPDGRKG
jgi:hypothetical protein